MLNWLNRQKSYTTAPAAAYPQPSLADWRNREKSDSNRDTTPGPDRVTRRNRKLKYLELFAIAVVISLIVGVDLYIFGINKRLSALENEFVEVKDWAFPASLLEGKYASLNARVRALTESFNNLDIKLATVASQQQAFSVAAEAAGDEVMAVAEADIPSEAPTAVGDEAMAVTEADIPSEAPAAGIAQAPAGVGIAPEPAEATGIVWRADEETPAAASIPVESPPVAVPGESAGDTLVALTIEEERPAEETPVEGFTSVESQPVTMPGGSTDETTVALNSVEEAPVEAFKGEPALPVVPAPATDAALPQGSGKEGPWVINLLSDPNEAAVGQFAARARDRGVPVEQNRAEVKGRVFWRVQLTGFATAKEAQTHAEEVKEKLRLKDVWIFKQQG
jgi:hypothetical protein